MSTPAGKFITNRDKNQSKRTRDLSSVNKPPEVIEKVLHQGSAGM